MICFSLILCHSQVYSDCPQGLYFLYFCTDVWEWIIKMMHFLFFIGMCLVVEEGVALSFVLLISTTPSNALRNVSWNFSIQLLSTLESTYLCLRLQSIIFHNLSKWGQYDIDWSLRLQSLTVHKLPKHATWLIAQEKDLQSGCINVYAICLM